MADVFNQLPDLMRRPTEILGLFHIGSDEDALLDERGQHLYRARHPDGSDRAFHGPALRVTEQPGPETASTEADLSDPTQQPAENPRDQPQRADRHR